MSFFVIPIGIAYLFGMTVGFWISDRYNPAKARLDKIKALMIAQDNYDDPKNYPTLWVDLWVEVGPYEET